MQALLITVIAVFVLGMTAVDAVWSRHRLPPSAETRGLAAAEVFMSVRDAISNYMEADVGQPSSSGALSAQFVESLPGGSPASLLPGFGDYVLVQGNVRTLYLWETPVGDQAGELQAAFPGDATLGTAQNGAWVSQANAAPLALPTSIPNGDVMSVIQLGS